LPSCQFSWKSFYCLLASFHGQVSHFLLASYHEDVRMMICHIRCDR
jgi:hypothetical protein